MSDLQSRDEAAAPLKPPDEVPISDRETSVSKGHEAGASGHTPTEIETQTAETMKGLFGRDSLYMLLWGVQLGMVALSTPIITRLLGVSQFGVVAATLAVVQVVAALSGFGLQSAVQRVFADGEGIEMRAGWLRSRYFWRSACGRWSTQPDPSGLRHSASDAMDRCWSGA